MFTTPAETLVIIYRRTPASMKRGARGVVGQRRSTRGAAFEATHDHGDIDNFASTVPGVGREVLRPMIHAVVVGHTAA